MRGIEASVGRMIGVSPLRHLMIAMRVRRVLAADDSDD